LAGFVIKLPSSRRCALSAGVRRSPFTGAPDDDVRIGPVFRSPWRSSPGGLDFLPGLAYDLQRVAILSVSRVDGCAGGNMLFKSALALLVAWLIGVLIVGRAGELIQLLLLAGLALFLLAFLRAREAALRRATSDTNHTR
jgi:hypothetical protein